MRPKRVILCVDSDATALSMRKVFLESRGFRVLTAGTAELAIQILMNAAPGTIDLLCVQPLGEWGDGNDLVLLAKRMHPEISTMLLSRCESKLPLGSMESHADVLLPRAACVPAEIYERIRVLLVRKRGPKKARSFVSA